MRKPKRKAVGFPEGYGQTEFGNGPTYDAGDQILGDYCRLCFKRAKCKKRAYLANAMGDNFPFWSDDFIEVQPPSNENDSLTYGRGRWLCRTYQDRQMKLRGMKNFLWSDSITRLLDIVKAEQANRQT